MHDVIIVGGGILGVSAAYHLVCEGARTLLIDRCDEGRATDAGAGALSPVTYSESLEPLFDLAMDAFDYYPIVNERLQQEQEEDTGFARAGKLVVAVSEDEVEAFEEARKNIFARQKQRGSPSAEDLHDISSDEARALLPPLGPVLRALYYRNAARVDGRLLAGAFQRAAVRRGLVLRKANVEKLILQNGAVTGVECGGETLLCGQVVIAGGAWSAEFEGQLGIRIPVKPERGQIIHLSLPGRDTADWPTLNAYHMDYMVPWPDSRVVVGATHETGAGFRPQQTIKGIMEVLGDALRVAPGLEGAEILEIRVGLRPQTPDMLPVLGSVPGWANLFLLTGNGRTGLQVGPYSGKIITQLLLGQTPQSDIDFLNISRFL